MGKVLGIVAEYNPFHNGHLFHLEESKKITGATYTIAVMSGNFTQRGSTSLIDKWSKAKSAIENGIDLVIELPVLYSISSAENFAEGAIKILNSKLSALNATGLKTWLQSNPVKVAYHLAQPYYEPIQADKLLLEFANDSTIHIDTVVPVESVKASYTGNVPSVYALEETNNNQDSLIDISLCATDEMYMMLEPILEAMPQTIKNERMVSKMVDMYVAMVIRGLKTIEEVPARYRKEVQEILDKLEK